MKENKESGEVFWRECDVLEEISIMNKKDRHHLCISLNKAGDRYHEDHDNHIVLNYRQGERQTKR
jgi:hypothetical protein